MLHGRNERDKTQYGTVFDIRYSQPAYMYEIIANGQPQQGRKLMPQTEQEPMEPGTPDVPTMPDTPEPIVDPDNPESPMPNPYPVVDPPMEPDKPIPTPPEPTPVYPPDVNFRSKGF